MKITDKKSLFFILCVGAWLFFLFTDSFAAEKLIPGRKLYDIIMRWVNFGILAAVFLKFARKPLMDALHGVREKIKENLDVIKNQFNDAKSGMDAEQAKLDNIEKYLE